MRKAGQTWHFVARTALETVNEITPKELGERIGVHYQKATKLLQSLGWIRDRHNGITTFTRPGELVTLNPDERTTAR